MDLEVEIPIWYNGKMKWISNLTTRSTCSDVIQAVLSSDGNHSPQVHESYVLYESWRGVERPLKARCRLLKLWNSWAGESHNVTLTLRNYHQSSTSTYRVRQPEKKFKRHPKRTETNHSMFPYLNLYRSIINTQTQLEYQQKLISSLMADIEQETRLDFNQDDFTKILSDVNQTLIISRQLNEQSEELDENINLATKEIDQKQHLLDELELDYALDQNIDIDSLDDDNEQEQSPFTFEQERVSTKDISPSPSTTLSPKKTRTGKKLF
ncbi:unnamed protein product [Adineta ricciae]|uniref:Uncharacterized protein n=1 Tax=Adineta ricciae TaxID=249248 RepID=A0A816G6E8_ADIRI|nr:unnamed protein product [Adineta ricciae]